MPAAEQNTVLEVEHVLEKSFLDLGKSLDSPLQVRYLLPCESPALWPQAEGCARARDEGTVCLWPEAPLPSACLSREAVLCALGSEPWP